MQEVSGSECSSSSPVCRLWVAATTAGIRSEHVEPQDAAASNMYAMCGIKELVILKIQAVSSCTLSAAVTCCMSMCTTVASDCDVTRECVALRMQNLPMPRHVQSWLYFIL